MTSLNRVVVEWAGTAVVGRAVTVLHYSASDNAAPPVAGIRSALQAGSGLFPVGLTITVPGSGDVIDDTTGDLVGVWNSTAPDVVSGGGAGNPAAGVGMCIGWSTGGIVNGKKGPRKLRGRTFLVPLSGGGYDSNGTLIQGAIDLGNAIASGLMSSGPLAVWHRPTTLGGTDGNSYGVQSFRIRDKVAFLSSRRD